MALLKEGRRHDEDEEDNGHGARASDPVGGAEGRPIDLRGDDVRGPARIAGVATGQPVDEVEGLKGGDERRDEHEKRGGAQHRQAYARQEPDRPGAVELRRFDDGLGDRLQAGEEEQRDVADVLPHVDEGDGRQGEGGVAHPLDPVAEKRVDESVRGVEKPFPHDSQREGRADPRQNVEQLENAGSGKPAVEGDGDEEARRDRRRDRHEGKSRGDEDRAAESGVAEDVRIVVQAHEARGRYEVPVRQ